MAEQAWHEPDPGQKDHKLHKIKMKCGCWTYYQRGTGCSIYTMIINDSCERDHELAAGPNGHPPGEGVELDEDVSVQSGTKLVGTELESVKPPRISEN